MAVVGWMSKRTRGPACGTDNQESNGCWPAIASEMAPITTVLGPNATSGNGVPDRAPKAVTLVSGCSLRILACRRRFCLSRWCDRCSNMYDDP